MITTPSSATSAAPGSSGLRTAHAAQTPPEETLSATRHVCTMSKVDDLTLKVSYDAPQPILPEYLACYVKGGIGQNGPPWMYPKHYMKQFHPKYNPSVPKDWDSTGGLWEQKSDWIRNPDCPTLTGYKCKRFDNNKGVILERNPYYYAVTDFVSDFGGGYGAALPSSKS